MSVLAPPPQDELELLIREARARQRRRRLIGAAVVAVVAGLGLSLWAAIPGGGSVGGGARGPITGTANGTAGRSSRFRQIADLGSSGGVTWIVNGHGIWLTANGGRTWRKSALPQGTGKVYSGGSVVQFLDRRRGWMAVNEIVGRPPTVGVRGVIARTADGGLTWRQSFPPGCARACMPFGQISFLDPRHGWVLASDSGGERLLRTSDGGRTWKLVSRPSVGGPITFVDSRIGFLAEPQQIIGPVTGPLGARLYRTTDCGRTWSQSSLPWSPKQAIDQPLFVFGCRVVAAVLPPNKVAGWPEAVYTSSDGGRSWTRHAFPQRTYLGFTSFSAASPTTWFVAVHRTLLVTHNAGLTWRTVVLRSLPWKTRISKIDFTSRRDGWAIFSGNFGGRGSLFRTTDAGRHWTPAGPRAAKRRRSAAS